jgi:hypothetical protein
VRLQEGVRREGTCSSRADDRRHFQAFGGRSSAHDYDGDDVLFLNADYYCVTGGRTGELLVGPVEVARLVKWWAAYASSAVHRQGRHAIADRSGRGL